MFAGFGVGVGEVAVRMNHSCDGQSIDGLRVADGVSSGKAALSFDTHEGSAAEDALNGFVIYQISRHAGNRECCNGASTHGVDIRQGIGSCDATVELWVIDDRGEEVRGLNQRDVIGEFEYTGIVCGR